MLKPHVDLAVRQMLAMGAPRDSWWSSGWEDQPPIEWEEFKIWICLFPWFIHHDNILFQGRLKNSCHRFFHGQRSRTKPVSQVSNEPLGTNHFSFRSLIVAFLVYIMKMFFKQLFPHRTFHGQRPKPINKVYQVENPTSWCQSAPISSLVVPKIVAFLPFLNKTINCYEVVFHFYWPFRGSKVMPNQTQLAKSKFHVLRISYLWWSWSRSWMCHFGNRIRIWMWLSCLQVWPVSAGWHLGVGCEHGHMT